VVSDRQRIVASLAGSLSDQELPLPPMLNKGKQEICTTPGEVTEQISLAKLLNKYLLFTLILTCRSNLYAGYSRLKMHSYKLTSMRYCSAWVLSILPQYQGAPSKGEGVKGKLQYSPAILSTQPVFCLSEYSAHTTKILSLPLPSLAQYFKLLRLT